MQIYSIDGITPVIHESSFIHPTAVIIGDVIIGKNVYIGPNASLRGDFGRIIIHDGANIQDNCVMHGFANTTTIVEKNGHIGHGAVLHGCVIGENSLVGMNSVVMDGSKIGEECIIGAMCFVKVGMQIPRRSLVAGIPAKIIRDVTDQDIAMKFKGTETYQQLVNRCFDSLTLVEPLREIEENRPMINVSAPIAPHLRNKS